MSGHPQPSSPDWNAWATLANDVSAALLHVDHHVLLDVRTKVAEDLWAVGYRPTSEQIAAEQARQLLPRWGYAIEALAEAAQPRLCEPRIPPPPDRPEPLPDPTAPPTP